MAPGKHNTRTTTWCILEQCSNSAVASAAMQESSVVLSHLRFKANSMNNLEIEMNTVYSLYF